MGERLRETGQEYGASTGRPRRCGWFDAVAVRYAVRVNGMAAIAVTKLDVLDGFDELKVCTAYQRGSEVITEMPSDSAQLAGCTAIYETFKGWSSPTRGVTQFSDLPAQAREYVRALEIVSEVPVVLVSTGSERTHTIFREGTIAEAKPVCSPERRPCFRSVGRKTLSRARGLRRAVLVEGEREQIRDRIGRTHLDVAALHHVEELAVSQERHRGR
jgi:hypothetical protein